MKILVSAAGSLDAFVGGGQVYVQNLARELHHRGRDLAIVCESAWEGGNLPFQVNWRWWNGLAVAGVSVNPAACSAGDRWSSLSRPLLDALHQVVDEVRPDLIHMNGMKPALTRVAIEKSIPHVITAHHGGIACPAGTLLRPDDTICDKPMDRRWCGSCYCRQLQSGTSIGKGLSAVPACVYRPLGMALNVLPNPTYAGRVMMYPWLVERAIAGKQSALVRAQRFIAPSSAIASVLIRSGAPEDRVVVVPHGIAPLKQAPLEPLVSRPVRFGYVGGTNRPKGVRILLQAFSRLPPGAAELQIVGSPQRTGESAYLEEALRPVAGRRNVILKGAVSHERMGEAMAGFDVLVLPTICLEVFGLVVLEAFSVGRPVIVTNCGGPAETVRHGVDGLVVPPNDCDALADAMRQLVAQPSRIGELAASIRPVRTLTQHVDDVEKVYRTL